MCELSTALLAASALQIGQTVLGHVDASQQASAQSKAIAANDAQQQETMRERMKQYNAQAVDQKSERSREAVIERGRLRAVQGESGLTGNTQSRVIGESYFNEGYDMSSIESNRKKEVAQVQLEAKGLRAHSQSQLHSVRQPSLIGTGLQIAGIAANTRATQQLGKQRTKA